MRRNAARPSRIASAATSVRVTGAIRDGSAFSRSRSASSAARIASDNRNVVLTRGSRRGVDGGLRLCIAGNSTGCHCTTPACDGRKRGRCVDSCSVDARGRYSETACGVAFRNDSPRGSTAPEERQALSSVRVDPLGELTRNGLRTGVSRRASSAHHNGAVEHIDARDRRAHGSTPSCMTFRPSSHRRGRRPRRTAPNSSRGARPATSPSAKPRASSVSGSRPSSAPNCDRPNLSRGRSVRSIGAFGSLHARRSPESSRTLPTTEPTKPQESSRLRR